MVTDFVFWACTTTSSLFFQKAKRWVLLTWLRMGSIVFPLSAPPELFAFCWFAIDSLLKVWWDRLTVHSTLYAVNAFSFVPAMVHQNDPGDISLALLRLLIGSTVNRITVIYILGMTFPNLCI